MKARTGRKIRATAKAILNILDNETDWMFIPSKRETLRKLWNHKPMFFDEEYARQYSESSIKDGVDKLLGESGSERYWRWAGSENIR